MTPFKYKVFENIMENEALKNFAPSFSIRFSKVFKTLLKFFLIFFQCTNLKIQNDVMI